jgi:hypothetical protein
LLDEVLKARGMSLSAEERHRLITEAAVWLSSPWALPVIDAPLPAGRHDLIRGWFHWRLNGNGQTFEDIARAARKIAPDPIADLGGGPRRFGDPTSGEVAGAQASLHRRITKRRDGTTTRR